MTEKINPTGAKLLAIRDINLILKRVRSITMENHTDISSNAIISKLPNKLKFWIILLRLDRPIGWWLLLLPSWWVILTQANSLTLSLKLISLFTIGSILMRGAGCIINDLWDKDIDSQVTRTRNRPIANGSITSNYNGQNISCYGASDGEISASVTSGTAPYEYSLDNISSVSYTHLTLPTILLV